MRLTERGDVTPRLRLLDTCPPLPCSAGRADDHGLVRFVQDLSCRFYGTRGTTLLPIGCFPMLPSCFFVHPLCLSKMRRRSAHAVSAPCKTKYRHALQTPALGSWYARFALRTTSTHAAQAMSRKTSSQYRRGRMFRDARTEIVRDRR